MKCKPAGAQSQASAGGLAGGSPQPLPMRVSGYRCGLARPALGRASWLLLWSLLRESLGGHPGTSQMHLPCEV